MSKNFQVLRTTIIKKEIGTMITRKLFAVVFHVCLGHTDFCQVAFYRIIFPLFLSWQKFTPFLYSLAKFPLPVGKNHQLLGFYPF